MRPTFFFTSAMLSLAACASHPAPQAAWAPPSRVAEVPMYSPSEWAQMNADSSLPEIAPNSVEAYSLSSYQSGSNFLPVFSRGRGLGASSSATSSWFGGSASTRGATSLSSSSSAGHVSMSGGGARGHR